MMAPGVMGKPNKQAALDIGVSITTVEVRPKLAGGYNVGGGVAMAPDTATQSIVAAIRSAVRDTPPGHPRPDEHPPGFVTIARQPGAGGQRLAQALAEQLTQRSGTGPWRAYDRELIERVAHDHDLSESLVASIPDRPQSLLLDLAEGMRFGRGRPTDEFIYGKVVATIRALAMLGRAVIVGRGGVYCTQDLPGGVHVQLIAPVDQRARRYAAEQGMSPEQAADEIEQIERRRERFFARFWPNAPVTAQRFSVTINTARVELEPQVRIVSELLVAATRPAGTPMAWV